jgi:hypothetical protein
VAITAPVPRPTHHLSGDGPTAEWHSRATLGLVRSSPVHIGNQSGTPTLLSPAAPDCGFTHRRSLRARSPFTRPCRSFCCAYAELIRDQTPPDDFCNCFTTCEQPNQIAALWFLAGTVASTTFLFFPASRRSLLSSDAWRAALRPLPTIPVLVPPGYPGLPSRDIFESAPPPPSFPVGA